MLFQIKQKQADLFQTLELGLASSCNEYVIPLGHSPT